MNDQKALCSLAGHDGAVQSDMQAEQVLGGTRSSRADAGVLADQSVISHYKRLTGKDNASTSAAAVGPDGLASKQRAIEGECAICYDTLAVSSTFFAWPCCMLTFV